MYSLLKSVLFFALDMDSEEGYLFMTSLGQSYFLYLLKLSVVLLDLLSYLFNVSRAMSSVSQEAMTNRASQ